MPPELRPTEKRIRVHWREHIPLLLGLLGAAVFFGLIVAVLVWMSSNVEPGEVWQ